MCPFLFWQEEICQYKGNRTFLGDFTYYLTFDSWTLKPQKDIHLCSYLIPHICIWYEWGNLNTIYTTTYFRQSEYLYNRQYTYKVYDIFFYSKWRLLSILQFVMVHWLKRLTLVFHGSRVICILHWRNICFPITIECFSKRICPIPMC